LWPSRDLPAGFLPRSDRRKVPSRLRAPMDSRIVPLKRGYRPVTSDEHSPLARRIVEQEAAVREMLRPYPRTR
jgi:hypothetical protein